VKVSIISATPKEEELEKQINQFIENLDEKYRIVDIKYSISMGGLMHYSAMIIYDLK
jgi:sporulation protein Cse60